MTLRPDHATLVVLGGEEHMLTSLRRGRILARDDRAAAPSGG